MIETLYANGCSWTAGGELFPETDINLKTYRTAHTYPRFMADALGIPHVINDAEEGGSNDRIFRTTTSFIAKYLAAGNDPTKLFVVIGWTAGTRTELFLKPDDSRPGYFQHLQAHFPVSHWETPKKDVANALEQWRKLYAAYFCHPEGENDVWASKAYALQCVMEANNIPYLFTSALNMYVEDEWRVNDHQKNLDALLSGERFIRPKDSFMHFVQSNNLPVEQYKHPSEVAHKAWGQHLAAHVNTQNILCM